MSQRIFLAKNHVSLIFDKKTSFNMILFYNILSTKHNFQNRRLFHLVIN